MELICDEETNHPIQSQPIKHISAISSHHMQQQLQMNHQLQHNHNTLPTPSSQSLQQQQIAPITTQIPIKIPQLHEDGYEMPITTTFTNTPLNRSKSITNSNRISFSNSSLPQSSLNSNSIQQQNQHGTIINNNNLLNSNTIDVGNTILKVNLPPPSPEPTIECSSMTTLLPNNTPPPPSHIQMTHQLSQEKNKFLEGRTVI